MDRANMSTALKYAAGMALACTLATAANANPHYDSVNPVDFLPDFFVSSNGADSSAERGRCVANGINLPHGARTKHVKLSFIDEEGGPLSASAAEPEDLYIDVVVEKRSLDGKSIRLLLQERIVLHEAQQEILVEKHKLPLETKIKNRTNIYTMYLCSNFAPANYVLYGGHIKYKMPDPE